MIILKKSTSDKLTLTRSSAATIDVYAAFVDALTAATSVPSPRPPENEAHAFNSAATADIVASPANTLEVRALKKLQIMNKDAALSCVVTVNVSISGTSYVLWTETLMPGDALQWTDTLGFFKLTSAQNTLFKVLSADDAGGQAVNTVQPWFPTAGGLTVPGASSFLMEGLLKITSGATSHSTGLSFGGTATFTSLDYYAQAHRSAADTIISVFSGIHIASASNATVDVAGTQAAHYIMIKGIVRINAAGTLIPQFTFSANPTGTITVKRNSFFRLTPLGDNTIVTAGTWA